MGKKSKTTPSRKSGWSANAQSAQLSLPFDSDEPYVPTPADAATEARLEIPPITNMPTPVTVDAVELVSTGIISASPPPSEAQRENAYIMRKYDKLEGRLFYALLAFVGTFLLDVAVHGGLPIAQAWLKKNDMPAVDDVFISGACGLAALVFAGLTAYFYLSLLYYNPQRWFNISPPPHYSQYLWLRSSIIAFKGIWLSALMLMMAIVLFLSAADALALVRSIIWHISPTDWQTTSSGK